LLLSYIHTSAGFRKKVTGNYIVETYLTVAVHVCVVHIISALCHLHYNNCFVLYGVVQRS